MATHWRHLRDWAQRIGLSRYLTMAVTLAAIASGIATYAALTGAAPLAPDPNLVLLLLNLDLVLLLILGALIARRLVRLWAERRRGLAGSGLHSRLVVLFSLVAVTPTILVAVFAALFLNFGIQGWFSERVRTAVTESHRVARGYLEEHQNGIRGEALAMANDLNREAAALMSVPGRFNQFITSQTFARALSEALVFTETGLVLARSRMSFALEFASVPEDAFDKARNGEVGIFTGDADDRVRALVRLERFVDAYLLVGRIVDPVVRGYAERTQRAVDEYRAIEVRAAGLQIGFVLLFGLVALLLLLAAIWVGLMLANQLVRPLGHLATAAERVRAGDLAARVEEASGADEVAVLARTFNRMTDQLEAQRGELMDANRQLDVRRRFIETVLAGVSAGVIGLDRDGRINLTNRPAIAILGDDIESAVGEPLSVAVPEMSGLLAEAIDRADHRAEGQVALERQGRNRTLLVRITSELRGDEIVGFVATFDDISDLLAAQRQAAWADVARRIAHEIKNPLTPIQLSAERLKRRYLKEISSDPEVFKACTETIVRQVGDIGRMVDEFSAFARMPAPVLKPEVLQQIAEEAVFLQRNARQGVSVKLDAPKEPLSLACDARQIRQALTNLLQNAADAIEGRVAEPGQDLPKGRIELRLFVKAGETVIEVSDNGRGLPSEIRDRLTEPYVTTRAKGTGLGLAIVRKIAEDHRGRLILADRAGGGATVSLVLPGGELTETATNDPRQRAERRLARYDA
jgi:two-component system nitrogen regulation sensor histidine kinase NtrY